MTDDKLRIELTRQERNEMRSNVIAISFAVENGAVSITEEWQCEDEIVSTYVSISIPKRIWLEGIAWVSARLETA